MDKDIRYYLFRIQSYDGNNVSVVGANPEEFGSYSRLIYFLCMNNILAEHMNSNIIYVSKLFFDTKEEATDYFYKKYNTEGIEGIEWYKPTF